MSRYFLLAIVLVAQPAMAGQWPHYADGTVYCFDKERSHRLPHRMPVEEALTRCDHAVTLGKGFADHVPWGDTKESAPPMDGWYDPDTGQVAPK
jgi:hypothetical protein